MLSLANAFSEDDLKNFEKKIYNFLDQERKYYFSYSSAEPKIDGISASLFYSKWKIKPKDYLEEMERKVKI